MKKRVIFCTLFLISLVNSLFTGGIVYTSESPLPFFNISILVPNSSFYWRFNYPEIIQQELAKIGIGIDVVDDTGWAQISPRTWGYPGPYPIPTYAEGGYDILFVGWSGSFYWDPTSLFDTASIPPVSDNFYQYSNPEMDWAIANYTSSFSPDDLLFWIDRIQQILYEDLPQITVFYPGILYPHHQNFTGWNPILWSDSKQPMVDWNIPGFGIFKYATPADFEDFHPLTVESYYDLQWLHQIFNGLLERTSDNNLNYNPWLAESFNSTDGLTWYVKIKDSACWADGTPLTVDDVIYNYQLAVTPSLSYSYNWIHFPYSYYSKYWDNDSIIKINDHEFTITFKEFYPFQVENLGLNLIPKHIWEEVPPENHSATAKDWAINQPNKLFGAGPFMLANYDVDSEIITLEKNPHFSDWYGKEPHFDEVSFINYNTRENALGDFNTGSIHMVDYQFAIQIEELDSSNVNYTITRDPGTQEIAINNMHPILGTGENCPIAGKESAKHVRKAISHIIPRIAIIHDILGGIGFPGITACPNVAFGFNESLPFYAYSQPLALEQMGLAGYDVSTFYNKSTLVIGFGFPVLLTILGFIPLVIISQKQKKV